MFKSLPIAMLAGAILASTAAAQCTKITTLYARNNGGAFGGAVYFDVTILNANGLTIQEIDTNTNETGPMTLDVYLTAVGGTSVGNQTNPALWTMVSTGAGVGAGPDLPTTVDVADFNMGPGTYGMALVMGATSGHDYTNGNGSNQSYSNADIQIDLGSASNAPFTGNIFNPRVWNGSLCYSEAAECWMMLGGGKTNIAIGNDVLLVRPDFIMDMTLTNLPKIPVPNVPGLIGLSVYGQGLLWNPYVYPNDPIKLTQGWDFKIGVSSTSYGVMSGMDMWPIGSIVVQPGGLLEIDFKIL